MEEMLSYVRETFPLVEGTEITASQLVFEERVKMNCFYCGRYNVNWKCPPKLPDIDFKKLVAEYDRAALVYVRMKLGGG